MNGSAVDLLRTVTCLGITIDQQLTFTDHVRRIIGRCFQSQSEATTLNQKNIDDWHCNCPGQRSVVISRIDYCNAVLAGVHGVHLRQLQWFSTLQRVWSSVSRSSTASHPRYVTSCIGCRSTSVSMYKLCTLVSNCLHDFAPVYLSTMC